MRNRSTSASILSLSAVFLVFLAACSGASQNDEEIDRFLCNHDDVGPDFIELARGEFTPEDLANLSTNASAAKQEYESGGLMRGRFVFLKEVLSRPPFDPPLNLLCQVLEFDSEADAQAYASGLGGAAPQWAGIAWLPDGDLVVEPAGENTRRISFREAGQDVTVLVRYGTSGSYFYSVYLGRDAEAPPEAALDGIVTSVAARADAER